MDNIHLMKRVCGQYIELYETYTSDSGHLLHEKKNHSHC